MPSPFSFPAWDATSGATLDPLPYTGTSFGRQVNSPGPFVGSLQLGGPEVNKLAWNRASQTGNTILGVDLGGTLIWGGVVWTRRYAKKGGKLIIGATEIGSYFRRRLQAGNYEKTWEAGAKVTTIANKVMEDALAVGTLGAGVTLTIHESGVAPAVEAKYPASSLQTIDSIISALSQMGFGSGMDYSFDVAYKGATNELEIIFNVWFPRQGRLANETGIVLLDKDTVDWEYAEDSTGQAMILVEQGSGGGISPIIAEAKIPGYPLLEETVSRSNLLSESQLAETALGDLGVVCYPVVTPWVELQVPGPLNPGEFALGDDLIIRVDPVSAEENTNPRFPEGLEAEFRINGWTITPGEQGVSIMHLDLAVPPISVIPPIKPPL